MYRLSGRTTTAFISTAFTAIALSMLLPGVADAGMRAWGLAVAATHTPDGQPIGTVAALEDQYSTFNSFDSSSRLGIDPAFRTMPNHQAQWHHFDPKWSEGVAMPTRRLIKGSIAEPYRIPAAAITRNGGAPQALVVVARGNYCGGRWASMRVTVDDRVAFVTPVDYAMERDSSGKVADVNGNGINDSYRISGARDGAVSEYVEYFTRDSTLLSLVGDGNLHTIRVTMVNPYKGATCQRELRVASVAARWDYDYAEYS